MNRNRRSIRLRGYDYSQAGAYFVTICTQNRECLFGEIVDSEMVLNGYGDIVAESWVWLAQQYEDIDLDEWVIMPNHLHGIIGLSDCRGGSRTAPTGRPKPLGRLIGAFKTVSTKGINIIRRMPGAILWQRNYYEHIIRHADEFRHLREYIVSNPTKWELDRENPVNATDGSVPIDGIGSSDCRGGSRTAPTEIIDPWGATP